ncbi:winged helix DNA-binding protein [Streptomyces sp. NPDC093089]|uniref:MarR family winged helix-turn-helix transcriptional regulator n=1 Tax=Streptomyces sp. NPDC093089 TaxID=3366024 RepID=UPI0038273DFF
MEQPVITGTAHDPAGNRFTVVGISNVPTDWAQVFRSLAASDLALDAFPPPEAVGAPEGRRTPEAVRPPEGAGDPEPEGERNPKEVRTPGAARTTPPSVLDLNAYLMAAVGKAARRRLTDTLAAHGLRLWHLTVMALLDDLGPQMKTLLAARLDINASDLVKVVNDLVRLGHVACGSDPSDRRRVVVHLTPAGRASLAALGAEIAAADDDVLTPLDADERLQLAALLRRVHHHLEA